VELRAKVQRELAAKEKEAKELRELAMRARLDRAGGAAPPAAASRGAGVPAGAPRRPRRARTASCACDARDVWRPLRCTSVNLAVATRPCCRLAVST